MQTFKNPAHKSPDPTLREEHYLFQVKLTIRSDGSFTAKIGHREASSPQDLERLLRELKPSPQPALPHESWETTEEYLARGGRIEKLPSLGELLESRAKSQAQARKQETQKISQSLSDLLSKHGL